MKKKRIVQKGKEFSYLRTTAEKYERITGVHLRADIGPIKIVEIISGDKKSKRASWEFIVHYCEGEHFISRIVRQQRNLLRKQTRVISIAEKNEYSAENAKDLYNSPEWRRLRVKIIEEQNGECQMCGRSHKKHGIIIHVDPIIPLSVDWSKRFDESNLQLLCEDCNLGKGNRYSTDWRRIGK
jgi:5-methylcytosine-specific restriction endonuclease McrA